MVNVLFSQSRFYEDWAKCEVQKYINKNDKLVIIPFSFSEEYISSSNQWHDAYDKQGGKYYKEIVEPFLMLGIDNDNITWINYFEDTNEEMKNKVEGSDIVFLTGGLPHKAVERVREKQLIDYIKNCPVVMGISAGAVMQLQNYYISPDEDYPEFNYYKGIGLIDNDFYIEVHYEDTNVQNDCIKKVLHEKTNTIYAIKNDGGVIVDNRNITLLGNVVTYNKK